MPPRLALRSVFIAILSNEVAIEIQSQVSGSPAVVKESVTKGLMRTMKI